MYRMLHPYLVHKIKKNKKKYQFKPSRPTLGRTLLGTPP